MNYAKIVSAVVAAYLEAVVFTDIGPDSDIPSDAEFSPHAVYRAWETCADFLAQSADLHAKYVSKGRTWDSFGHDIWLTRNSHGAGFWDRGLGELGDKLSDIAKHLGTADAYAGDDGLVYFS